MENISIKVDIYDKICKIKYYIDIHNIYRYSVYEFVNILYLQDIYSDFSIKLLTEKYTRYQEWVMYDSVKTYKFSNYTKNVPVMHLTQLQQLVFKLSSLSLNSEVYIPHGYPSIIFNVLAGNYQLNNTMYNNYINRRKYIDNNSVNIEYLNEKIDKLNNEINSIKHLIKEKDLKL